MGRRLRQSLRHRRGRHRARAGERAGPGARHRRPGRPQVRAARPRHDRRSSCCRRRSRCSSSGCAAAARISEEAIQRRLETARDEVAAVREYDYVVVNDELDACVDRLRAIVLAERARLRRDDVSRRRSIVQVVQWKGMTREQVRIRRRRQAPARKQLLPGARRRSTGSDKTARLAMKEVRESEGREADRSPGR